MSEAAPDRLHLDRIDPERLRASSLVARVEYHESMASTQDRALQLARDPAAAALPLLIVAEEQTAGRGRGSNSWWTGRGSLAFSLLFDPANWALSTEALPERSLAIGLAIVDTVQPLVPQQRVGLHWPNDVFVADKKLAGILVDVLPGGRHVIGIGLNVNNSLAAAPDDVRSRAVSLCELAGRTFDRTTVLIDLLANLASSLREVAAAPTEFGRRFQEQCLQLGHELTIRQGEQRTTGRCAGVAPDGALLLETPSGLQRFYSGVLH